jgi:membrane protease YdiL (CAAX protease family)
MREQFRTIFEGTRNKTEEESILHKTTHSSHFDSKVFIVCITSALSLVCINYLNTVSKFSTFLKAIGLKNISGSFMNLYEQSGNHNLFHLEYWALMLFFFYFIVPLFVTRFILKENTAEFGLSVKGALKDYRIYVSLIAVMLPVVFAVSFTSAFQAKYPFYDPNPGEPLYPDFFTWECFYFLQFVGLEFFFRGFLLHGIKKQFGYYSVLVMMLPYCMIHFGKPMAETIGAIVAGIVLGTLSLKSRSIWLGVAIHYSVALTMDICAIWQKGFFGH